MPAGVRELPGRVALLDVEPALAAGICADELPIARERCAASVVCVRRGAVRAWSAPTDPDAAVAYFVIRGVLTRRLVLGERTGAELFGPGDVVHPCSPLRERTVVSTTRWRADEPALLAVLDARFHRRAAAWPQVAMALHERSVLRSHSLLLRLAIAEHPRIVQRVRLVLWHLADRWGRPSEHGVLLPLRLSRVALADLVCSTRESVSRSLRDLERRELVVAGGAGYLLRLPAPGGSSDAPGARPEDAFRGASEDFCSISRETR